MVLCLWSLQSRRTSIHDKRLLSSAIQPPSVSGFRVFPYAESCILVCAVLPHSVFIHAGKVIRRDLRIWNLPGDLLNWTLSLCRPKQTEQPNYSTVQRRFTHSLPFVSLRIIPRVESHTVRDLRCLSVT